MVSYFEGCTIINIIGDECVISLILLKCILIKYPILKYTFSIIIFFDTSKYNFKYLKFE